MCSVAAALSSAASAFAQDPLIAAEPVGPAPADGIIDDGRIFSDTERDALAKTIEAARTEHGLEVYVSAHSFLLGESIAERAERLVDAWLTTERGIVVVYLRSSRQITFAASEDMYGFLSRTELMTAFKNAAGKARTDLLDAGHTHADCVLIAVDKAVEEIAGRMEQKSSSAEASDRRLTWLLAVFGVALVGLGALAVGAARLIKRTESRRGAFYFFPPVHVGRRFGAKFAGGSCAEIRFADSAVREARSGNTAGAGQ